MQKLTMIFTNNGGIACGWTETMWTSLTDSTATRSLAQAWMTARSKILSNGYQIIGVRISSNPAVLPVVTYLYTLATPLIGVLGAAPDFPNTAVLISLRSGTSVEHRSLRGWPDAMIEGDETNKTVRLTPDGQGLLQTYIAYLAGATIGWARLARPGDGGYLAVSPDTLSVFPDGNLAQLNAAFDGAWSGANKKPIRVRGFKDQQKHLNGAYGVQQYGVASTFIILQRSLTATEAVGYIPRSARVIQQSLSYASVNAGSYERITAHKTGRPFAQLRGRR